LFSIDPNNEMGAKRRPCTQTGKTARRTEYYLCARLSPARPMTN
jgi:hypothetical protein